MSEIPAHLIEACRPKAANAAKLNRASGTIRPGWKDPCAWRADVHWVWEQGRHGEDSGQMKITCTVENTIKLEVKP